MVTDFDTPSISEEPPFAHVGQETEFTVAWPFAKSFFFLSGEDTFVVLFGQAQCLVDEVSGRSKH